MKNGTGRKIRLCKQCGLETESTRGNGASYCLKCARQRLNKYYRDRERIRKTNVQTIFWQDMKKRLNSKAIIKIDGRPKGGMSLAAMNINRCNRELTKILEAKA